MASFKYICLIALIGSAAASGGPRPRARTLTVNRAGNLFSIPSPLMMELVELPVLLMLNTMSMIMLMLSTPAASDNRLARQGGGDDVPLDIGAIAAAGERCIDKVVMVEETEYDDHIECHHSYSERCHTTYTTDFEPQQEEECEENFKKSCFIEYKKVAVDETVKFCHTPLVCEGEGPEECKTVYESECETKYHEHDVEDDVVNCETIQEEKCEDVTQGYTTEQKCTKWPKQVCTNEKRTSRNTVPKLNVRRFPDNCVDLPAVFPQPGPEECFDKKETIVQEVPEENCNLEPQKACKQVTKLVPSLKPVEECVDIPKEVCSRSRKNPRKVQKPVVKKWCYVPSAASGLAA
ncbi:unnamed protein product [Lepeophtheirus salmonis]|uniref:(salmon louse) hypothetical protein n=1 Tax=Lepeophtheirus salmonis TaxID=72036 RepID=A0A7R8H0Q8_LEPSM|nr:unnamed protein product [Lepeophtheirus salmonis]CAF2794146.1 unnamed protein product [Lepeophtheirus salmonis]